MTELKDEDYKIVYTRVRNKLVGSKELYGLFRFQNESEDYCNGFLDALEHILSDMDEQEAKVKQGIYKKTKD